MPLYEYQCDSCGRVVERTLPVDERDSPMTCIHKPEGSRHPMPRIVSRPASWINSTDRPTRGQG